MQRKKCVLSIILVLALVITMTNVSSLKVTYAEVVPPPEGTIGIYTAQDLNDMRNNLTADYTLMNDIDLTAFTASGDGWLPVGTKEAPFAGSLNGNGYSISGLRIYKHYLNTTSFVGGLFGYGTGMEVNNLNLSGIIDVTVARAEKYAYLGGIVGCVDTVAISNCAVNLKVKGKAETVRIGGLVGKATFPNDAETEKTMISGCKMSGEFNASARSYALGGAIGEATAVAVSNCENKVNLYGLVTAPFWTSFAGGICGMAASYEIDGCTNDGKVTTDNAISGTSAYAQAFGGGILGGYSYLFYTSPYPTAKITNCTNRAMIDARGTGDADQAGISARLYNASVTNCDNYGKVQHNTTSYNGYSSGIVGVNYNGNLDNCDNYGTIYNTVSVAAGIIADSIGPISNCQNFGSITGNSAVGIAFFNEGDLTNCRNVAPINGLSSANGICYSNKKGEMMKCFNSGNISSFGDSSGIVWSNRDLVHDSYNIGFIKGHDTGGICGNNEGWALIDNCYNIGGLDNEPDGKAGGITVKNSASISQSYYLDTASKGVGTNSAYASDGSVKIAASQLKSKSSYNGFDFTEDASPAIWLISPDSGLPTLKGQTEVYIKAVTLARKPVQLTYFTNKPISTKGAWLKVEYSDGSTTYVDHGFTLSSYTRTAGAHTISLNYGGQKVNYSVTFYNIFLSMYDSEVINIQWTPFSGATTVKVYQATSAAGPYKFVTITDTFSTGGYQGIGGLVYGQVYYYKLRPMYGTTPGAVTGYASIRYKPNTPENIMVYNRENGLQVNWDNTIYAENYELYCSKTLEGPYTKIASTVGYPSYTHNGIQRGVNYYYAVRSYVVSNGIKVYGNFSEVVSGRIL